jgi:hypothetical protein
MHNRRKVLHSVIALIVSWIIGSVLASLCVIIFFAGDPSHSHPAGLIYVAAVVVSLMIFIWALTRIWRTKI